MIGALGAGLLAGSALLLGSVLALVRPPRDRTLGLVMAFGAGVLMSAVAYDLVQEALGIAGGAGIPLGIAAGALTFYAGDTAIERAGGGRRKAIRSGSDGSPKAVVLGSVLDGVPESAVIGLTLLSGEGLSVPLVAAIYISNLPEAMAGTVGLRSAGMSRVRVLGIWAGVAVVSGLAALAGYGLLGSAPPASVAFVLAFAAGAVLTMLADTMMPEAFGHGGRAAGLATALGFVVAFGIAQLEQGG